MTESPAGLTSTALIAAASQALIDGGYRQIIRTFPEWDTPTSRLFEDEYSIVGIVVFDTCEELLLTWPDRQGALVEVISGHVGHEESKSWDGYLVLLSPALAPAEDSGIEAVRYNTLRLRKLVATGHELRNPMDVERVIRPLLPLGQERANLNQQSALDLLPKLLVENGIPREITQMFVDSFREQSPLLERLHQLRGEQ